MNVLNVHERILNTTMDEAWKLISSLSSDSDKLWPVKKWIAMRFDEDIDIGAIGGHGPIRYRVEAIENRKKIEFSFIKPRGFIGSHRFELESIVGQKVKLRHVIDMYVVGWDILKWLLIIRPMHDALIEDALNCAEYNTGGRPQNREWSYWVKFLRWLLAPKKRK